MESLQSKNIKRAHAAAVLLILAELINNLYFSIMVWLKQDWEIIQQGVVIESMVLLLLFAISFILLFQTQPNKPTRIALYILMIRELFIPLNIMCDYLVDVYNWPGLVFAISHYLFLALSLGAVYPFSLIYRNNDMNKHDIAWSNFLIIRQMCIVLLYCNYALISLISNTDLLWQDNILYRIFVYIFLVLTSIAFWRFTHCAAFTGTEEQKEPEEENYKPIARYVVAAAVTLALAIGIFLLAEPILNAVG
jgi:hypothetical protein